MQSFIYMQVMEINNKSDRWKQSKDKFPMNELND